ncbi:MAG: hypothetical protein ACK4PK_08405 [Alphaproteobacteria bacterium]
MNSKNSKKIKRSLRQQFSTYAADLSDYGHDTDMFYTSSHVVLVQRGGNGTRIKIIGYSEKEPPNPQAQLNSAAFESDPLWTPERTARKATAESLAAFIAKARKDEERAAKTARKTPDSDLRVGHIRISLG